MPQLAMGIQAPSECTQHLVVALMFASSLFLVWCASRCTLCPLLNHLPREIVIFGGGHLGLSATFLVLWELPSYVGVWGVVFSCVVLSFDMPTLTRYLYDVKTGSLMDPLAAATVSRQTAIVSDAEEVTRVLP
jgi:hypothetical protein